MCINTRFIRSDLLVIIKILQSINFLSTRSQEFVDRKLTSCQQTPNFLQKEKQYIFRFHYTCKPYDKQDEQYQKAKRPSFILFFQCLYIGGIGYIDTVHPIYRCNTSDIQMLHVRYIDFFSSYSSFVSLTKLELQIIYPHKKSFVSFVNTNLCRIFVCLCK